jgi:hypothetical protein
MWILRSRRLCRSIISSAHPRAHSERLTTIRNRGDNLLDRPSFDTSSSALEEKSTRSAAKHQLNVGMQQKRKLTRNPSSTPQHFSLGTRTPNIKIITHKLSHAQQTKSPPLLPASKDFMSIIPLSSIHKRFFLTLPESLDLGSCLVLSSHMGPPCSLDTAGHGMPVLVPFSFKVEEGFGILDECLGDSHLPFVTSNLGIREDSLTT